MVLSAATTRRYGHHIVVGCSIVPHLIQVVNRLFTGFFIEIFHMQESGAHQVERRGQQTCLDLLTHAGALPGVQRGAHSPSHSDAGRGVDERTGPDP